MPLTSQARSETAESTVSHNGGVPAFIGRQPIFDRDLNVFAYELLFRNRNVQAANVIDGDSATAQTLVNGIMDFGLEQLVGNRRAFVNLTRNFLLQRDHLPALQGKLVLEVLEDITPDPDIIAALQDLVARGYVIALDDFTFREELRPLVEVAQIIKLELPKIGLDDLPHHVARLKPYRLKLLAEKIETRAEFERCKALGIDYFQGYFLSRPDVVEGKRLPANKIAVLEILAKLQNPRTNIRELERLVSNDVSLSFRILRFVNSVQRASSQAIENIRSAIMMAGLEQVRIWASLIVLSQLDDKPPEMFRIALLRSRLCELLSKELGRHPSETYSTAGLFSTLDALLDRPLAEILNSLPLNPEIVEALLHRRGAVGEVLQCTLACERGAANDTHALGITEDRLSALHLDAIAWTETNAAMISQR